MNGLRRFGQFWYDFIIGDAPGVALGVVVALALSWALVRGGLGGLAWVALPLTIGLALAGSVVGVGRGR